MDNTCIFFVSVCFIFFYSAHSLDSSCCTKSWRRLNYSTSVVDDRLLWSENGTESLLHCAILCFRDLNCASYMFNSISSECAGHAVTLGSSTSTNAEGLSQYYVMENGRHYIGDVCQSDGECSTAYAQCIGNRCICPPGLSFSPTLRICNQSCEYGYGEDFTMHGRYFIQGHNVQEYFNVSLEACQQFCNSASSFTCRTFEYGYKVRKCALQEVTKLDVPSDWYADVYYFEWDHFQRDCL